VRVGVLASGTGTILQALIDAEVPCPAEKIAEQAGIAVEAVVRDDFSPRFDRDAYTDDVVTALAPYEVGLVAMAGFGTVIAPSMHAAYPGRILNTHPALLPAFKGWHAVADALAAGVKVTGCTVHVATLEVDEGLILAQIAVPVLAGDDEETLHERIKEVERTLYPATVHEVLQRLAKGEQLT